LSFGQRETVFDGISASPNYIVCGAASIYVNSKCPPGIVRFIRGGANLFLGIK